MIDRWYRQGFALALAASMAAQSACGGGSGTSTSGSSAQPAVAASSGGASAAPVVATGPHQTEIGEQPPDFPSQDPNRWVNGQAFTLASAHGDVVLVESWHRL